MTKLEKITTEEKLGCVSLLGGIFQNWSPRRRKPSLPENHREKDYLHCKPENTINPKFPPRKSIDPSQIEKSDFPRAHHKPKQENHFPRRSLDSAARKSNSPASTRTEGRKTVAIGNGVMGNIIVKQQPIVDPIQMQRRRNSNSRDGKILNNRLDPEVLKNLGNDEYWRGRFREALVFYEKAISADPKTATYWCNKSAALISLGRLLEASDACNEAIRLNPCYERAHHRLANLYTRLGEAEKALYHHNQAGKYADSKHIEQAQDLIKCLARCNEARKSKEWNMVVEETCFALSYGADSSPRVYALQTEALLQLRRHEEAYSAYQKGTNFFDVDSLIKIFGLPLSSYLLAVGAQAYIAAGRFDDAVTASRQAARLDPNNGEVNAVVRRARAIASARLSGNLLFNASKFELARVVYTEGLEQDPHNALLLCNRAACRYKLGQFEKSADDCTAALDLLPSYRKARRRRADSYAKLEKWQCAVQDYELLMREAPGDEEIRRALIDGRVRLRKQTGDDFRYRETGSELVWVNGDEKKWREIPAKLYIQ